MIRMWRLGGCLAGLWAGVACGAIVAEYTFNQNLNNSAGAGYALSPVGGNGTYAQENVFGENKNVLSLAKYQGLDADVAGWAGPRDTYTIVMDINCTEVSSYQKVLSFDGAFSDTGFYLNGYDFVYYSGSITPNLNNISPNTWMRLALSRSGNNMAMYVGTPGGMTLVGSKSEADSYAQIDSNLTFLKDDTGTSQAEDYPLKVSGIWISDTAMDATGIQAVPEPSVLGLAAVVVAGLFIVRRFTRA